MAMRNNTNVFCTMPYFISIPTDIPENASVEAMEISIPPISSTPSIPRVMIMMTALFFNISEIDFNVMKEGLRSEITIQRTISTISRLASRESVIFFKTDLFSFIFPVSPLL